MPGTSIKCDWLCCPRKKETASKPRMERHTRQEIRGCGIVYTANKCFQKYVEVQQPFFYQPCLAVARKTKNERVSSTGGCRLSLSLSSQHACVCQLRLRNDRHTDPSALIKDFVSVKQFFRWWSWGTGKLHHGDSFVHPRERVMGGGA